jgi:hypothetical protein
MLTRWIVGVQWDRVIVHRQQAGSYSYRAHINIMFAQDPCRSWLASEGGSTINTHLLG